MAWTALTYDYGSVLTSTKMVQLFNNLASMAAGEAGAPTIVVPNGAVSTEAKLADAIVAQAKLKTSTGTVNVDGAATNITLPGGQYGFYPRVWSNGTLTLYARIGEELAATSAVTNIWIGGGYASQRYVTSSGEVFWVFLCRELSTGKILWGYQSPDHPCFGNGGDPILVQHPFPDYNPKLHEIIVVNPAQAQVDEMQMITTPQKMGERRRDILELIMAKEPQYELREKNEQEYGSELVTVGIIEKNMPAPLWASAEAPIIKVQIPQPDFVKVLTLKQFKKTTMVY